MKKFIVAVDVGRSSVKVKDETREYSFPFVFSRSRSAVSEAQLLINKNDYRWVTVDGEEYLFGKIARLVGSHVFDNSEGDQFQEVSAKVVLYAVADFFLQAGEFYGTAEVAINLTFDNYNQKKSYQDSICGEHTVFFKEQEKEVKFQVERVAILYQGYSGLLDIAMNEDYAVAKEFLHSSGMVIDIGRRTVDFLHMEDMVPTEGKSEDFGTFKLYEKVAEVLKKDHNIVKKLYEIEEYVSQDKVLSIPGTTKQIDVKAIVKVVVKESFQEFMFLVRTFLAKKTPDYIVLFGGGALLFQDLLKKEYPVVKVPANPQFSNVNGLYKFLYRIKLEKERKDHA